MGLLDRMIGNAIAKGVGQVANQVASQAASQVGKQIKDSGVIESTIDDMANKMTGGTKFAKIMKCPFCGVEYDNTLTNCPGCGAANENRKYDYQAHKNDGAGVGAAVGGFAERLSYVKNAEICINCSYGKSKGFSGSKVICQCQQSENYNQVVWNAMDGAQNTMYPGGKGCSCFNKRETK